MGKLTWADMNSLNAIAGLLRHNGFDGPARTLVCVQHRATEMLMEQEEREKNKVTRVVHCNRVGCDHNTYFTKECMYELSDRLIQAAKAGMQMCDILAQAALNYDRETRCCKCSHSTRR